MKLLHAYPFTFWEGKAFWAHPTSIFDLFLMVWGQQVIYSSLNSCHNFLSTTNHFWQAITFWHWHMKQAFLKLLGKVLVALLICVREKSPSNECAWTVVSQVHCLSMRTWSSATNPNASVASSSSLLSSAPSAVSPTTSAGVGPRTEDTKRVSEGAASTYVGVVLCCTVPRVQAGSRQVSIVSWCVGRWIESKWFQGHRRKRRTRTRTSWWVWMTLLFCCRSDWPILKLNNLN